MASTTTTSSIISGEPMPITNIMEQVVEMKNICVDGVALSGMVMESLGEKLDQMHHNIKRTICGIDLSVGNLDSDMDDINTRMERVEERIEEMAVELGAMHHKLDDITDKVDQIYKFLSR